MTIQQAIDWLVRLGEKHGREIEVYFDCPACQQSFTPGQVVATVTARATVPAKETP